jgi:hypothetical protein
MAGLGFPLIVDTKTPIIKKIKNLVVQSAHHSIKDLKVNYFKYVEFQLNRD